MKGSVDKPKGNPLLPFRQITYGLFLTAILVFSGLIIFSVVRSVWAMSPARKPSSEGALTVAECLQSAQSLWQQLDNHRKELSARAPVREADAEWSKYRVQWMEKLRDSESRCAVDSHSRTRLKQVFSTLDKLMDLYTTHAVQYAGEIGESVDRLRLEIREAIGEEAPKL